MSGPRLVLHQFRYDLIEFVQNPQSRFFTVALPVLMLAILVAILGSHHTLGHTGIATLKTYYVPAMLAFGVVWASVVNLAVTLTVARERGILKRRRATPLPAWGLIASQALTATVLSLGVVAILLVFGKLVYGVGPPAERLPAVALVVLVGAASFCCLGYALVTFIGSEDGALPVVLGVALPLYFISGIFIEFLGIPSLLRSIAEVFPVRHLAHSLLVAFASGPQGKALDWGDLLVVAAWGLGGLALAIWRFRWGPRAAAQNRLPSSRSTARRSSRAASPTVVKFSRSGVSVCQW